MAGSSSKEAPFLTYLTVFQSRLGLGNLALSTTSGAFLPLPSFQRALERTIGHTISIQTADEGAAFILDYLLEKRLITGRAKEKGRYSGWSMERAGARYLAKYRSEPRETIAVSQADVWFAHPEIRSTIGVPTVENVGEIVDLAHSLRIVSRAKNAWTSAALTVNVLRGNPVHANPFVLGLDAIGFLRQILACDWLILEQMMPRIISFDGVFSRDDIAIKLPEIAAAASKQAKALSLSPSVLSEAKAFAELVQRTASKADASSGAPGVLEHRTAPRLEWLTDCRVLSKDGLARNGFQYRCGPDAHLLDRLMRTEKASPFKAENVAIRFFSESTGFSAIRDTGTVSPEPRTALAGAFQSVRRSIGPAPIREVGFVAAVQNHRLFTSVDEAANQLVRWAAQEKGVTLSGGKFNRAPEFVHLSERVIGECR